MAHIHSGEHPVEAVPSPSGPGSVVLDIGGDTGAAVVFAPEWSAGLEIEIAQEGMPWDGTHTMIRARDVGGGQLHAGVFASMRAGRYRIRLRPDECGHRRGAAVMKLTVVGGEVTYGSLQSNPLVQLEG